VQTRRGRIGVSDAERVRSISARTRRGSRSKVTFMSTVARWSWTPRMRPAGSHLAPLPGRPIIFIRRNGTVTLNDLPRPSTCRRMAGRQAHFAPAGESGAWSHDAAFRLAAHRSHARHPTRCRPGGAPRVPRPAGPGSTGRGTVATKAAARCQWRLSQPADGRRKERRRERIVQLR
jgi:hypothetical protein